VSGAQSVLIASGSIGAMVVWLLYVRRPWVRPRHALTAQPAAPAEHEPAPGPVPPRVTGCACGVRSGEHKLWCATADAALDWAARNELPPPVERTDGGAAEPGEWFEHTLHELAPDGLVGPPTRQLMHDLATPDGLGPGAGYLSPVTTVTCPSDVRPPKVDSPAPGPGAGDESEPSGVTAPPAPPCCDDPYGTHAIEAWHAGGFKVTWDDQPAPTRRASATEVANAQADAFMAAMRADHAAWMASARARWAAA
jgi:hypothetical protein